MADSDLDKYLEDLGINMADEEEPAFLDAPEAEAPAAAPALIQGEDPLERTESFLVNLLLNFDPAYAVEVSEDEDGDIRADIYGGDSGKIIGRGGRTLQALEYLANAFLSRGEEGGARVSVDVGGYKRRRDERLRELARQAAEDVRQTGEPYAMKPMTSLERRIIHMELADDPSVRSESEGEGRNRRVVVKPS
jgi:spoIIIJ-associated protein